MDDTPAPHASWQQLLAAPPPGAHVAHWYENDAFLAAAVAHYAAEGLARGESVALRGTREHLDAIVRRLGELGAAPAQALRNGQLALADAHETLAAITPGGVFDERLFESGSRELLERARAGGRFGGIRWWGEMSDPSFVRGNAAAAVRLEEIVESVAREYGATVFCSVACERFDARAYDGVMLDVCRTHTHVIPAHDYAAHRIAVNRALAEVVGTISGSLLQSLASWRGPRCELPSSQALLFWLREALPEKFEAVLERARIHDAAGERGAAAA